MDGRAQSVGVHLRQSLIRPCTGLSGSALRGGLSLSLPALQCPGCHPEPSARGTKWRQTTLASLGEAPGRLFGYCGTHQGHCGDFMNQRCAVDWEGTTLYGASPSAMSRGSAGVPSSRQARAHAASNLVPAVKTCREGRLGVETRDTKHIVLWAGQPGAGSMAMGVSSSQPEAGRRTDVDRRLS